MRIIGMGVVLITAVLYRLPYAVNAAALNSDHAVVGLQARAILRGEWSWYLWGVGYQASLEPLLTAGAFKLFGDSPQSLAVVGIAGFLLFVAAVYWTLSQNLSPFRAMILSLFAVFTVGPITQITVFPPRIWAIAILFSSFPLYASKRPYAIWAAGIAAFLSLYVDYYAIQLLPAALWYGFTQTADKKSSRRFFLGGATIGLLLLGMARLLRPEGGVPLAFSPKVFAHNVPLLIRSVLPILGGFAPSFFGTGNLSMQWQEVAEWSSGILASLLLVSISLFSAKKEVRDLSRAGAITTGISLLGFSGSSMASDIHSVRFLGVIVWMTPFTLAALAFSLKRNAFALLLIPLCLTTFLFGWNSLSPNVQGMTMVRHPKGQGTEEMELIAALRQRGVKVAQAQFWTAYRLSFLSQENPIVVPDAEHENRYRPHWELYQTSAQKVAIFQEGDARSSSTLHREYLDKNGFPSSEWTSGPYRVFIWNNDKSPILAGNTLAAPSLRP